MSAIRRWSTDPRVLLDLVVVAAITVLVIADVASAAAVDLPWERSADGVAYAIVLTGCVVMFWRRRFPITVLLVVSAALMVFWLRGHGAYLSVLGLPALYAAAAHAEHRRGAWWAMTISCVLLMLAACTSPILDRPDGFSYMTAFSILAFLIAAIAAGTIMRNRERIFVDTERRAAAAEADRLAEAQRAVLRERRRIAREMHDVVAHSMSVIAVQAAAGREIVHDNPDKAADVFARIENVGRESLTELRRMLGVLRESGDDDASLSPQPGLADIGGAVAASTATGVPTELVVEGTQRTLGPGVELAVYRIVQEALTNVRKHAGGSATATVRLCYGSNDLVVEVTDDGRGAATSLSRLGSGQGLIGMRERIEIYGGEFSSGPRPGGGYSVRATLPIAGVDRDRQATSEPRPSEASS